jgi:hypothetical protein
LLLQVYKEELLSDALNDENELISMALDRKDMKVSDSLEVILRSGQSLKVRLIRPDDRKA